MRLEGAPPQCRVLWSINYFARFSASTQADMHVPPPGITSHERPYRSRTLMSFLSHAVRHATPLQPDISRSTARARAACHGAVRIRDRTSLRRGPAAQLSILPCPPAWPRFSISDNFKEQILEGCCWATNFSSGAAMTLYDCTNFIMSLYWKAG